MILVIDNYDSFTYNLVQYLGELRQKMDVVRNDKATVAALLKKRYSHLVVSPGPCTPNEAGISVEAILAFAEKGIPVLGVCLGHQSIGQAYGGKVVRAKRLMHGKTSPILHDKKGLFKGLPNPFEATRYHSLIVQRAGLPRDLQVTARTRQGEIMGLKHRKLPVFGVQFHPESILTEQGKIILSNFLSVARRSGRR